MHYYDHSMMSFWRPLGFIFANPIFTGIAILWLLAVLALKGYALWHAAKRGEVWWFVFLLVLNTFGILELVYIVFILKKVPRRKHSQRHHSS